MRESHKDQEITRLIEQRKQIRAELKKLDRSRKIARELLLFENLKVLNLVFNRRTGEVEDIQMKVRGARRKKKTGKT